MKRWQEPRPRGRIPATGATRAYTITRRRMFAAGSAFAVPALSASRSDAAIYQPEPLPKGETRNIVLGVGGTDSEPAYLAIWAAQYGGYFDALKQEGINVTVVPFPSGGADAILALTSGRTHINYQSCENAVRAQAQGRDAIIIYNAMPTPGVYIMARAGLKDSVHSVADTKGLRWGVTAFGASGHTDSLRAAAFGGVDSTAIRWIALGGQAGLIPSVREGRVDIFVATPLARTLMLQQGLAFDLLDMFHADQVQKIYGHGFLGLGLLSSRAYCDQNTFVAYRVTGAVHQAVADAVANPPEELAAVLPAQFQSPALVPSIATMLQGFSPDGNTPLADAAAMASDMLALKLINKSVDAASVVDNRFVEAVRAHWSK